VIASFDAYVFVTPEYNRSIPAALKNAIDFLYPEWNDKAAGFVSYGADAGGARAVEHLRLVMGELRVADVRTHVALSLSDDFEEYTTPAPRPHQAGKLTDLINELLVWAQALRTVREPATTR
jgi:NAD(P)H-dependent FMN reductase